MTTNGTNTILLIPESELVIDDQLQDSASRLQANAVARRELGLKRLATDDISRFHHVGKKRALDDILSSVSTGKF